MHRTLSALVLTSIIGLTAGAPPLVAQEGQASPSAGVESELQAINASLRRLVALLEIQVENQKTQLAVQRLDLARRDIVDRERELHDARVSRDSDAEQLVRLEESLETLPRVAEDSEMDDTELEMTLRHLTLELESAKQRVWRLDQRILDLEGELVRAREDLRIWEEVVAGDL